jgi:hypothetical protein
MKIIRQPFPDSSRLSRPRALTDFSLLFDGRIIRVVGFVFSEIDSVGPNGAEVQDMLLRDLVRESLETIDCLCTGASGDRESDGGERADGHQVI